MTTNGNGKDAGRTAPVYHLPESIIQVLIQQSDSESFGDLSWWASARMIADYVTEMPESVARLWRASLIREAAVYRKVQPSTMREEVHTAEVFTRPVEGIEEFAIFGKQHFVRAARTGDNDKALSVLRRALEEVDRFGGQCPPVARINELVAEMNGHKPVVRRRWSGTVVHVYEDGSFRVRPQPGAEERPEVGAAVTVVEVPHDIPTLASYLHLPSS